MARTTQIPNPIQLETPYLMVNVRLKWCFQTNSLCVRLLAHSRSLFRSLNIACLQTDTGKQAGSAPTKVEQGQELTKGAFQIVRVVVGPLSTAAPGGVRAHTQNADSQQGRSSEGDAQRSSNLGHRPARGSTVKVYSSLLCGGAVRRQFPL